MTKRMADWVTVLLPHSEVEGYLQKTKQDRRNADQERHRARLGPEGQGLADKEGKDCEHHHAHREPTIRLH